MNCQSLLVSVCLPLLFLFVVVCGRSAVCSFVGCIASHRFALHCIAWLCCALLARSLGRLVGHALFKHFTPSIRSRTWAKSLTPADADANAEALGRVDFESFVSFGSRTWLPTLLNKGCFRFSHVSVYGHCPVQLWTSARGSCCSGTVKCLTGTPCLLPCIQAVFQPNVHFS